MIHKHYVGWTVMEKERIVQALRLGCCIDGVTDEPLEVHHLISGGKRMGHWYTIVLARSKHRNMGLGVTSIAHGSKAFEKTYQTNERRLWEATQRRLGLACNWPGSKVVPRVQVISSSEDWA